MSKRHQSGGQGGFTLIEAVISIAVIGILGAIVAVFIKMPVQNYKDSTARAELTDTADLALRRMARDLRLALPNSIRVNVSGKAIEFLQTRTGGRYLAIEDGAPAAAGQILDFNDPTKLSFNMLGEAPSGKQTIAVGDYIVVNNPGPQPSGLGSSVTWPPDAYQNNISGAQKNIVKVTGVSGTLITMASNPFASQSPSMPSPTRRFQVVTGPVTYYCVPGAKGSGTISRQWNYAITDTQQVPPVPVGRAVSRTVPQSNYIAKNVTSCSFAYDGDAKNVRAGIVRITITLELPETEPVQLTQEVHVDNTP